MQRYLVADVSTASRLVALRDLAGGYHVARCTAVLPEVDAVLEGYFPAVGIALLTGEYGEYVRLTFTHVNCGLRRALELLHADGERVAPVRAPITVRK
jgi:hypothetical protein